MARYIPDNIIDQIKAKSDIVDVIHSYLPLKRSGSSFKALCPFHNEKTPSFNVNSSRQMFYCFGCGKGGDVVKFVMEKENVDYITAIKLLADRAGIQIPEKSSATQGGNKNRKDRLYKMHQDLLIFFHQNLIENKVISVAEYAKNRGITLETIKKFELGAAPDLWDATLQYLSMKNYTQDEMLEAGVILRNTENGRIYDRFRKRLIFPIKDELARIVGFSARTIDENDKEAKYVNSPETPIFKKSKILYALDIAKDSIRKLDYSVICEGQLDVIAMHNAGISNAVAPQGTSFTSEQAAVLKRYSNKVYMCFDGDQAGKKAIFRAIEILLSLDMEPYVIALPAEQDPDSILKNNSAEYLINIVNNPIPFFDFLINEKFKNIKSLTPFEKNNAAAEIAEYIAKVSSPVLRASFTSLLANKTAVPESVIFDELKKRKKRTAETSSSQPINNEDSLSLSPESQLRKAEEILLQLALMHGTYCRKIAEDIPESMISSTPVGKAIETAVSMSLNGEWEEVPNVLREKATEENDSTLYRILAIECSFDELSASKAYEDCVRVVKNFHLNKKISNLTEKLISEKNEEEQRKISLEIYNLRKEIISLNKRK